MRKILTAVTVALLAASARAGMEARLEAAFGVNANVGTNGGDVLAQADEAGSFDIVLWQWPETRLFKSVIVARAEAARTRGMGIMLGISPTSLSGVRTDLELPSWVASDCGLTTATVSFSNPCLRAHFIADVVDIAQATRPDSFHLATEINTLLLRLVSNPADTEYVQFASLYREARAAIRAVSPETRVFVSIQYELQKVLENAPPLTVDQNWDNTLNPFRGTGPVSNLDYVGFTTYPSSSGFLGGSYQTALAVPTTYYRAAALHLRAGERPVFSEIGWPSEGSGSELEQRQFLRRLPELMAPAAPAWVAWVLLHDIPNGALGFSPELTSTGLRRLDGSPKPAWREVLAAQSEDLSSGRLRVGSTGGRGVVRASRGDRAEWEVSPDGSGTVRVRVLTLSGRVVRSYAFESTGADDPANAQQWDLRDDDGGDAAAGVYVIDARGPGLDARKKIAVVR